MKSNAKKSFYTCLFILCLFAFAGSSCNPDDSSGQFRQIPSRQSSGVTSEPKSSSLSVADRILDRMLTGEFDLAGELLSENPKATGKTQQVSILLDQYKQMEQYRQDQKLKAYQEQIEDLDKIKERAAGQQVIDVNDIDDAMIAVLRAREYAPKGEKDTLLQDAFVMKAMDQMKKTAEENERNGKWIDAYAHCYYWLSVIYEENESATLSDENLDGYTNGTKTYTDKSKELTELAGIELSLKDSGCGETVLERHEGIQPVMFLRALHLLENNYVNEIDFGEMIKSSLRRCRLLGIVLEKSQEKLEWKASHEQVEKWIAGLDAIQDQSFGQPVNAETVADVFEDVLALNTISLEVPEEVVVSHFTEAALESLDPYTNIVWPWNVKDFEKSMTQQFTGIGVEISKATGVLTIVSLLPDTPAYKAGLDADDEIIAVDGQPTKEMTIYCAVQNITGPKGTKVTLTIHRPSTDKTWDLTITRAQIVVDPIRGWTRTVDGAWDYVIDPDNRIGYIRLTSFSENTGPNLDKALKKLENEGGLNALILDLRYNTGGYLQAASDVVDLFVEEGVIVKSNPRHGFATYEIAHRSGTHPNFPMVVLINGISASASEIVAGALQDPRHQRAMLVGERSYGKGSVQVVTPFTGGGSQMKYTVAYYHLPSDQQVKNRYQMEKLGRKDWGIAPDIEVKLLYNETRGMVDMQRDNDVLFQSDHENNGIPPKRHTLMDTIKADPQLAVGLTVLRAKLLAEGRSLVLHDDIQYDLARTATVD